MIFISGCGAPPEPVVQENANSTQTGEVIYPVVYGGTLVDSAGANPVSLNPLLTNDTASGAVTGMVFDGLLSYDDNYALRGDLAESWEVSADGMNISFRLRKGVKWHDGVEFTAEDVKFTYQKMIDPKVDAPFRSRFVIIDSIEIIDPYDLRVHYGKPFSPGLERWVFPIIPKHILENEDFNSSSFNQKPIGTGPYRFVEWIPDDRVILKVNQDYFAGKPFISQWIIRIMPDNSMAFLSLKRDELDLMGLTLDQYVKQVDSEEFRKMFNVYHYPRGDVFHYVGYNFLKPIFQDRRVRRALTMAIDRQKLIDEIFYGYGQITTGPFSMKAWAYDKNIKPWPYSPEQARVLLSEAGWKPGPDGILERDGKKFEFEVILSGPDKTREMIANAIASYWESVGVKAHLKTMEWSVFLKALKEKNFDATLGAWSVGPEPDHYHIWHSSQIPDVAKEKAGSNYISYSNPEADRLWDEGRATFDMQKRREIYGKIHALLHEDQPYTFLFVKESIVAVNKRVKGVTITPSGLNESKFWYIPEELRKY
ncbi:MAG: peptide-binding protein [Candidatus Wallbacteria bacterium]|nr:peptide-binding protein [Candidatus Wallbacteria bacterium]